MALQQNILDFFEFIYNRQLIYYKRHIQQLPSPWSDDEILQKFKFCNIYRELDGGTIAIKKLISKTDLVVKDKLLNIVAYRFFNKRDTIDRLFNGALSCDNFNFKQLEKHFDDSKRVGTIFSDAYLVSSHPYNANYRSKDKHVQILLMLNDLRLNIDVFLQQLQNSRAEQGLQIIEDNVAMAGSFLSGQILLDCTYSCDKKSKPDIVNYSSDDFLIVGPGAKWGLELIFDAKFNQKQAQEKCRYLYSLQMEYFDYLRQQGQDFSKIAYHDNSYKAEFGYVSLHDIQNSLCEYRKYLRLKSISNSKKRYFRSC